MGTRRQVLRTLSLGLLAWPLRIVAERRGEVWCFGIRAFPQRLGRIDKAPSNRKTARSLWLGVPLKLRPMADKVIE